MKEILVIGATWCAGCKVLKAQLDSKGVDYLYSDITTVPDLVKQFGIRSLPATIIDNDICIVGNKADEIISLAKGE